MLEFPFQKILIFMLFNSLILSSSDWVRGYIQIDSFDSDIRMTNYGDQAVIEVAELPKSFKELSKFYSSTKSVLKFRTSNRVHALWEGPGLFTIDQNESKIVKNHNRDSFYARSIYFLEGGNLYINASDQSKNSSLIIDSPIGRIKTNQGVFSIQLDISKAEPKKYCKIYCLQGKLILLYNKSSYEINQNDKVVIFEQDELKKINFEGMDNSVYDQFKIYQDFLELVSESEYPPFDNLEKILKSNDNKDDIKKSIESFYIPIIPPVNKLYQH